MVDFFENLVNFQGRDTAHRVALDLATVFLLAVVAAKLASTFKYVPKVTLYLLLGLALGPSGISGGLIDQTGVESMAVMRDVALSLILFLVGTEFRLSGLSRNIRRALRVSLWESAITFALTFAATLTASWIAGGDFLRALLMAVLLAIFALEVGPASTLAVIREHNSDGPYSNFLRLLVGNSNTLALILFAAAAAFILPEGGEPAGTSLLRSGWWLLAPLPIAMVLGLLLAWFESYEQKETLRLLMVLGVLMAATAIARSLGASPILAVLGTGFVYANSTVKQMPTVSTMRVLETPFYVMFFIYTGASLHLDELPHIGAAGIAYLVCRAIGKMAGTWYGARRAGLEGKLPVLLGASVLSHSAVVLALLEVVRQRAGHSDELFLTLQTLILGCVVVFEIFGPIMVKLSVLASGEVSIVNALEHKGRVVEGSQVLAVIRNLLAHLGLYRHKSGKTLGALVIADRRALLASSDFNKVAKFIESYPYDCFPVVDGQGHFSGYIGFNEIKDASYSYDPIMKDLVRAADLVTPGAVIDLDTDDIHSAYERIRSLTTASLPVIRHNKEGQPLLVGVILQRDLAAAHMDADQTAAALRNDSETATG